MPSEQRRVVDEFIMRTVRERGSMTAKELASLIEAKFALTEDGALDEVIALQESGRLTLEPSASVHAAQGYRRTLWYWFTVGLAVISTFAVFRFTGSIPVLVYARYVLGFIMVLWLPGYSFIKALFPTGTPIMAGSRQMEAIVQIALSLGMSWGLVAAIGLLLNSTPWGVSVPNITLSLLVFIIVCATVGAFRGRASQFSRPARP